MSELLDRLSYLSSAEEFFSALDVPFVPQVLNVARLHILRRMGQSIAALAGRDLDEAEIRTACREALVSAYDEFTRKAPIETRLFKVLREHDPKRPKRDPRPFVSFDSLTEVKA
jgi:nitrogenase-stabilizing/protective protein